MNPNHEPSVIIPRAVYDKMTAVESDENLIEDRLKEHPEIINWNDNGEYTYRGKFIEGSSLLKMLQICQAKKHIKDDAGPGFHDFYKALADCEIPENLMKNGPSKNLLKLYKMIRNKEFKMKDAKVDNATKKKEWIKLK